MAEQPSIVSEPQIVSESDIRKQKILARITELKIIQSGHQTEIKECQNVLKDMNAKIQQREADVNYLNGALSEKQRDLREFNK